MEIDAVELIARPTEDGQGWDLMAPAVGLFALAPDLGNRRGPGEQAGVLVVLGRVFRLYLPEGVGGYVATPPPERRHLPVGHGTVLFQIHRESEAGALPEIGASGGMGTGVEGLCQCAAQAGRFYRRPEPQAPTYVQEGDEVQAGRTIGLIEVMKTFTPIRYEPGNHLPNPARIVRFFVDDGGDVEEGQALVEVQPLEAERGT